MLSYLKEENRCIYIATTFVSIAVAYFINKLLITMKPKKENLKLIELKTNEISKFGPEIATHGYEESHSTPKSESDDVELSSKSAGNSYETETSISGEILTSKNSVSERILSKNAFNSVPDTESAEKVPAAEIESISSENLNPEGDILPSKEDSTSEFEVSPLEEVLTPEIKVLKSEVLTSERKISSDAEIKSEVDDFPLVEVPMNDLQILSSNKTPSSELGIELLEEDSTTKNASNHYETLDSLVNLSKQETVSLNISVLNQKILPSESSIAEERLTSMNSISESCILSKNAFTSVSETESSKKAPTSENEIMLSSEVLTPELDILPLKEDSTSKFEVLPLEENLVPERQVLKSEVLISEVKALSSMEDPNSEEDSLSVEFPINELKILTPNKDSTSKLDVKSLEESSTSEFQSLPSLDTHTTELKIIPSGNLLSRNEILPSPSSHTELEPSQKLASEIKIVVSKHHSIEENRDEFILQDTISQLQPNKKSISSLPSTSADNLSKEAKSPSVSFTSNGILVTSTQYSLDLKEDVDTTPSTKEVNDLPNEQSEKEITNLTNSNTDEFPLDTIPLEMIYKILPLSMK